MTNDEWVTAAMADDRVVVELLVRLKQSQASSSMKFQSSPVIPLRWGLRQRRSKIVSPLRYDIISQKNKESTSTRCSPTTPLSWSCDTSPSATADGFEESSHPIPISFYHSSRSKSSSLNEFSSTAMAKRLKRKKALADLKVEECLLLNERVNLKKEFGSLHSTFKEQITNNEALKKIKLNTNFNTSDNFCDEQKPPSISNEQYRTSAQTFFSDDVVRLQATAGNDTQSETHGQCETNSIGEGGFVLPDLNMFPTEDCL